MKIQVIDSMVVDSTHLRSDGYLVADARVARTGIQDYLGVELGKPELKIVKVYRPAEEVFNKDAIASFGHRPITDDHPKEPVTSRNWAAVAKGQSDGAIMRDGEFLRVPLMVADQALIDKIQSGKKELSAGYTCDIDWTAGVTETGERYDAIQRNIRANHIAVVQAGRAGKECRVGDTWGTFPVNSTNDNIANNVQEQAMKVIVDGLPIETTDQGAAAIDKLLADREALNKAVADLKDAAAKAGEAAKEALAKKEAELDKLKEEKLDDAAIAKLVAARVKLESTAAKIAQDVKPDGLTDAQLKAAVVKKVLGDKVPDDKLKDAYYVDARFDILAEDATKPVDGFRDAKMNAQVNTGNNVDPRVQAYDDLRYFIQTGKERTATN